MAKKRASRLRTLPVLTLRVMGPRPGRIGVAELIEIAGHAQTAINRQAETLEGRETTLRPGPPIEKVRRACELELMSLRKGSTRLGFGLAGPQQDLPHLLSLSRDAIAGVGEAIECAGRGQFEGINPGVLDSLRNLGQVLNNKVTALTWIASKPGHGRQPRRRISAVLDRKVQARIERQLRPPAVKPVTKDGVLEMADFKPDEFRCRLRPTLEPPLLCTFDPARANEIQSALRHPVRIRGNATFNSATGKIEQVHIEAIEALDSLELDAGSFFARPTFEQLARQQAIQPLRDPAQLGGVVPDDFDIDEMVADIYRQRA